jgi:hypothetical protein
MQGFYRFRNLTVPDDFITTKLGFTFFVQAKFVVRVRGGNKNIEHSMNQMVIEYKSSSEDNRTAVFDFDVARKVLLLKFHNATSTIQKHVEKDMQM